MKLDQAVAKLLKLQDPATTTTTSVSSVAGGCSAASAAKIVVRESGGGAERRYFVKSASGRDAEVMFAGMHSTTTSILD